MNLDQLISRVPKPALVFGVLAIALILIVVYQPLKDECEVKANLFVKELRGITVATRTKGKIQYPQIKFWKDRCREGNTIGSCEDYLLGLRKTVAALNRFPDKCHAQFSEENEWFLQTIREGVTVIALLAWGEKPPVGPAERLGWLTEPDVKTFCALKNTLVNFMDEETFPAFRNSLFSMYPDAWPEKVDPDNREPIDRPKAMKSSENPDGKLSKDEVYERSLFSLRCDLYQ